MTDTTTTAHRDDLGIAVRGWVIAKLQADNIIYLGDGASSTAVIHFDRLSAEKALAQEPEEGFRIFRAGLIHRLPESDDHHASPNEAP